jgi:RNA polymerase sigma factor (sigma-70 family)
VSPAAGERTAAGPGPQGPEGPHGPPGPPGQAGRAARLAGCLDRARAGETGALQEVVRELTPLLWHVARTQGLSSDQAADVVQCSWLELLRRLHEIRSPRALTSWLVSTTRHEAWRIQRQARRMAAADVAAQTLSDPGPDASERLIVAERHRVLLHHFRQLSERCQALLRVVAEVERPDYAVVAQAMSMPRGSIGPTRGRCLARLREMLLADPRWSAT